MTKKKKKTAREELIAEIRAWALKLHRELSKK